MSERIPRRRWIKTVSTSIPVAAAAAAQQTVIQAQSPPPVPPAERPNLEVTVLDTVGDPILHFFSKDQFATLRRLADILLPADGAMPGAVATEAPEFLDFYLAQSAADRQTRYKAGLDRLSGAGFANLDAARSASLLSPLLTAWTYHPPTDEYARFLREVKEDLFRAMVNSRQFAETQGGRRGGAGMNTYWHVLD